jgi:hypothetical protein
MYNLTAGEIRKILADYMKFGRSVASNGLFVDGLGNYFVVKTAVPLVKDRFNIGLLRPDNSFEVLHGYGTFDNLSAVSKVWAKIGQ